MSDRLCDYCANVHARAVALDLHATEEAQARFLADMVRGKCGPYCPKPTRPAQEAPQ